MTVESLLSICDEQQCAQDIPAASARASERLVENAKADCPENDLQGPLDVDRRFLDFGRKIAIKRKMGLKAR